MWIRDRRAAAPLPLQRDRRRTPLHNIVVINFLIAQSSLHQRGRLHSRDGSLLAAGSQLALIYLSTDIEKLRVDPRNISLQELRSIRMILSSM